MIKPGEEICRIRYASKSIKRPSDIPCCPLNISKLIRFRPLWQVPHRPPRPLAATFQEGESAELSRRCPLNMIDLGFAEDDLICSQWEIHCLGLLGESTGHFRTYFIYFYFVGKKLATALGVLFSIFDTKIAHIKIL